MTIVNKALAVSATVLLATAALCHSESAVAQTKWTTGDAVKLDTDKARLGYTIGAQLGSQFRDGGMVEEIDMNAFLASLYDHMTGAEPKMTPEEMMAAQQAFQLKQQETYAALVAQNQAASDAFIAQNKAKRGVQTTDSGLQYEVLREGKGAQPTAQDTVKVHYTGKLIDGSTFDSSYERNQPTEFPVAGVIPGFSEGLQLMKEGAKYRLSVPSQLAYGDQAPPSIGPAQALVFEIELLEVLNSAASKSE